MICLFNLAAAMSNNDDTPKVVEKDGEAKGGGGGGGGGDGFDDATALHNEKINRLWHEGKIIYDTLHTIMNVQLPGVVCLQGNDEIPLQCIEPEYMLSSAAIDKLTNGVLATLQKF